MQFSDEHDYAMDVFYYKHTLFCQPDSAIRSQTDPARS